MKKERNTVRLKTDRPRGEFYFDKVRLSGARRRIKNILLGYSRDLAADIMSEGVKQIVEELERNAYPSIIYWIKRNEPFAWVNDTNLRIDIFLDRDHQAFITFDLCKEFDEHVERAFDDRPEEAIKSAKERIAHHLQEIKKIYREGRDG